MESACCFGKFLTRLWLTVRTCYLRAGGSLFAVTAAAELGASLFCAPAKIGEPGGRGDMTRWGLADSPRGI
jgi:hypothetical protein